MSDQNRSGDGASKVVLLVIGIVLVVLGLSLGGRVVAPNVFEPIAAAFRVVWRLWLPLLIIGAGVLIIIAANREHSPTAPRAGHLYRSRTDKMLGGVLGGLGAYLGIDPTWLRIGTVLVALGTGVVGMLIAYAIAAAVIPEEPLEVVQAAATVAPPPPVPPAPGAPEAPQSPEAPQPPAGSAGA